MRLLSDATSSLQDTVQELVRKRDEARANYSESLLAFVEEVSALPLSSRLDSLQQSCHLLENTHGQFLKSEVDESMTLADVVVSYSTWKVRLLLYCDFQMSCEQTLSMSDSLTSILPIVLW